MGKEGISKFMFVAIDNYNKWLATKIIKNKNSEEIGKCICGDTRGPAPASLNERKSDLNLCVPLPLYFSAGKYFVKSIVFI